MLALYNGTDISEDDALTHAIFLSGNETQNNDYIIYVSLHAPQDMCCPLTKLLFKDPVSVIHGNTYEREAIERWFEYCRTDPLTGEILFITTVFENEEMKMRCLEYRRQRRIL